MKRILPKTLTALTLAMVSAPAVWSQTAPPALGDAANAELDSINAGLDRYESMARRSIMGGGSKPVSFAGEAIGRIIGSTYGDYPQWMQADATTMKNSFATLRVAMVAAPNRNLRLWSKISFNHALLGDNAPSKLVSNREDSLPAGYYRSPTTGEAGFKVGSLVFEDMCAGLIAKIGPTTWSAKMGGVLWNELSPLTVWKIQPRIFAWDYLPFELEQSTAQFYDYGTVKGEKSGRAAWNKKPFQGIQLESVELPAGMYVNGFFGSYEGYNKNQPWLIPNDKNTELHMIDDGAQTNAGRSYATKGIGIGDEYRWSYFARVSKNDLPGGVTAGANWFSYYVDENYPRQWGYQAASDFGQAVATKPNYSPTYVYSSDSKTVRKATFVLDSLSRVATWNAKDSAAYVRAVAAGSSGSQYVNNYYVIPQVGSFDFRRNIPGGLNFHVDVALSHADSVFYKVTTDKASSLEGGLDTGKAALSYQNKNAMYREDMREKAGHVAQWQEIGRTTTGWVPGVYADVSYPFGYVDAELRSVYFPKKFQSPASIANPMDGIFPYESNMTGAGKFAGEDNGTAYASNLMGSNLILKMPIPRGHAKLSWGLHAQVEEGKDLVYFPWRQNGEAYNMTLASNFTQYDQGLITDYLRSGGSFGLRQAKRLGDEFYASLPSTMRNVYAPTLGDAGGERAAYLSVYEGFAPYKLDQRWTSSFLSRTALTDAIKTRDKMVADTLTSIGSRPVLGKLGVTQAKIDQFVLDSTARYNSVFSRVTAFKNDTGNLAKWTQDSASWANGGAAAVLDNIKNGTVPTSKKFTQNLSFDLSYEISRLWGGKRSLFFAGYAAFNSVTKNNRVGVPAFSATDDDVLLMGRCLRFEPVFQVTPKFYLVGLLGNEIWKSKYGVAYLDSNGIPSKDGTGSKLYDKAAIDAANNAAINPQNLVRAPIDYSDWIYGLGFDWDMASRVGLHVRCQYFTHEDKGISVDVPKAAGINDYDAWLTTAEVKMWF